MFRHGLIVGLALVLFALATVAAAQEAPEKAPLKVTVVSVTGVAHKRAAADPQGKWEQIKVGDALDELTIIRTGLGAEVVLRFSDRGDTTVRSATKLGIGEFYKQADVVTTRLALKYGSLKAKVDSTRGANDFAVSTPVATLGVGASGGSLGSSGDFGTYFNSTSGTWNATTDGRSTTVGPGGQTDGNLTNSGNLAAGNRDTQMGDPNGGTTGNEQNNLINNGSGLGLVDFSGGGNTTTSLTGNRTSPSSKSGWTSCYQIFVPHGPWVCDGRYLSECP